MNCPLCGSAGARTLGARSRFSPIASYQDFLNVPVARFDREIARCTDCGFQFVHPMYGAEDLGHLYGGAGYRRFMGIIHPALTEPLLEAWTSEFVHLGVRDLVTPVRPRPRFLDVGCGMGRNMIVFDRLGFEVRGLDMNIEETDYVRDVLRFPVHNEELETFARRGETFDCVLASHFIEHVTDPHRFFDAVLPLVRPGGALLVETPLVSDFSGAHAERYKDIYHTLFWDHFTLALAGHLHGAPAARMRNVLYFATDNSFNLNIQVRYERATAPTDLARAAGDGDESQLRLARKAYDAITSDAIVWARSYQDGMQSSGLARLAHRFERALSRFSQKAARLPLRIRQMLRHSGN